MDFRHHISSLQALAGTPCDALVLIVTGAAADASLDAPLASALTDALAEGDLTLKAGKTLYLHRPAGVKAPRVVFAATGPDTLKAFRAAVVAGINAVKGSGARHVVVALAGAGRLTDAHADWQIHAYGNAGHAFTDTALVKPAAPGVAYDERADRRSWKAMTDFLAELFV